MARLPYKRAPAGRARWLVKPQQRSEGPAPTSPSMRAIVCVEGVGCWLAAAIAIEPLLSIQGLTVELAHAAKLRLLLHCSRSSGSA